jgi:alkylation response protein AidB-like acyl-CoA dehydrogenase
MEFGLSQDQLMLTESLTRFLADHAGLPRARRFAAGTERRDRELLAGLAGLGITGIVIPEAHGGVGLTILDAALAAECLGRAIAPAPFVANAVMAPLALLAGGSDVQQTTWLPRIAAGDAVVGVAVAEACGARQGAGVTAKDGRLTGRTLFVLDADADAWIVADREGALHLVEAGADGVTTIPLTTVDRTRPVAELVFANAPAERLPGSAGGAALARILDAGRVVLAADTLGAAQAMLDQAVAYAREREQFGRKIGSFQAVKHMCAEMAAALEPCRALVWYAGFAQEALLSEAHLNACQAKAHLAEVGKAVAKTATEVHGGMGFTDLLGLHFWFKRIGFNRQMLGSPERLREDAARAQALIA